MQNKNLAHILVLSLLLNPSVAMATKFEDDLRSDYREVGEKISRYLEKVKTCDDPWLKLANVSTKHMYLNISEYQGISKRYDMKTSDVQRDMARDALRIAIPVHIDAAFGVADKASSLKCNTLARETYNSIIENYVGNIYQGIRDRAMSRLQQLK